MTRYRFEYVTEDGKHIDLGEAMTLKSNAAARTEARSRGRAMIRHLATSGGEPVYVRVFIDREDDTGAWSAVGPSVHVDAVSP